MLSRVRRKTMDEGSTNFGAGMVQHCSKLHPSLWRGLRHPSSVCRAHLFWGSTVPWPVPSLSPQRYLVHLAVPKALGEALVSSPRCASPEKQAATLKTQTSLREKWVGKGVNCEKVFISKTFSRLTTPAFKYLNQLAGFYGSVNLLEIW